MNQDNEDISGYLRWIEQQVADKIRRSKGESAARQYLRSRGGAAGVGAPAAPRRPAMQPPGGPEMRPRVDSSTGDATMRNRIAQLLDVVSLVKGVRQAMLSLDRSSALVVFVLAFLGSLVTGTLTWIVDWLPTWKFANGEDPGDALYTAQSIGEAAVNNAAAMANVINGLGAITLGGFIGASIAVGITLLPTIIQFIAPRVIHPVARTSMDASIGFDFITDWPSAAMQAAGVTTNPIGQFLATIGLVFIYSLLLQSVFVLCLTACVFSAIVLVSGEGRAQRVEVVEAR